MLRYARANGCAWNVLTCAYAAAAGHLDVLQWAREEGCPWNEATCAFAAAGGHLEILQWARARGCPWGEETCASAARGGRLEVWCDVYVCVCCVVFLWARILLVRRPWLFVRRDGD